MKAVVMTAAGDPEVLQLVERPEPLVTRPDQVLVRLMAAGVNPIDTKVRSRGTFFDDPLPVVLGCDGAGVVEAIGSGVTRYKPGDRVWFCHGGLGNAAEQGNYAEFTVVAERWLAPMPASIDFETAAAAPLVLITAWGALFDRGMLEAGQHTLIHAGAGGVGHVAIQLAKWRGAEVATTVSNLGKAAFCQELGADICIDYQQQDLARAVDDWTGGQGADLVFDTVGPNVFRRSIPLTAHFGNLVSLLDPGTDLNLAEARIRNLRIGFELMLTPMLRGLDAARDRHVQILNECSRLIDSGQLAIHVSQVFPLEQAAEAHRLIGEGHMTGKTVLQIASP